MPCHFERSKTSLFYTREIFRAYAFARAKLLPTLANMTKWIVLCKIYKEVHYRKAHGNLYFHYAKLCYYCITIKLSIITSLFFKDWKRGLRIFYIWVGAGLKGANRISCARFYTRCFDIVLTWQSLRNNLIAFGTMSCSYYAVFCIANRYYFLTCFFIFNLTMLRYM